MTTRNDKDFVDAITAFRTGVTLPSWKDSKIEPFPIGREFLVGWVVDNYIDRIEWYSVSDNDVPSFWDINSSNLNEFNGDRQPPTHWMDIKLTV